MTQLDQSIARCLGRKRGLIFCDRSYQCHRHVAIYDDQHIDTLPPVNQHCCNAQTNSFIPLPEAK